MEFNSFPTREKKEIERGGEEGEVEREEKGRRERMGRGGRRGGGEGEEEETAKDATILFLAPSAGESLEVYDPVWPLDNLT